MDKQDDQDLGCYLLILNILSIHVNTLSVASYNGLLNLKFQPLGCN